MVPDTGDKLVKRLKRAEDEVDEWGNTYIGKQTDELIKRRVMKGK
jgi:hypothetical protein